MKYKIGWFLIRIIAKIFGFALVRPIIPDMKSDHSARVRAKLKSYKPVLNIEEKRNG